MMQRKSLRVRKSTQQVDYSYTDSSEEDMEEDTDGEQCNSMHTSQQQDAFQLNTWFPLEEDLFIEPLEFDGSGCGPLLDQNLTLLDVFCTFWDSTITERLLSSITASLQHTASHTMVALGDRLNANLFYAWIAVFLEMGQKQQSHTHHYWRGKNGNEFIKSSGVSKHDWNQLFQQLFHKRCVSDEILLFIEEALNKNYRKHWKPFRKLSFDEIMVAFKGKSSQSI